MTPELHAVRLTIEEASSQDVLFAIIAEMEGLKSFALVRALGMQAAGGPIAAPCAEEGDELLTVEQVAGRLHASTRWVRNHGNELGRVQLGRRAVRFDRKAVDAFVRRRAARR